MKAKKKLLILFGIAALVCVPIVLNINKTKGKEVTLAVLQKKNIAETVTAKGNIQAIDTYEALLNTSLKVAKLYHKEGDSVKKDEPLAVLDTTDLELQLKKATASLDIAKITLNKLLSSNTTGDRKTLENSVASAKIALEDTKRNLADAQNKFSNNENLYKSGFLSKTDYDASKNMVEEHQNKVKAAELALANAENALSDASKDQNDEIELQKKQIELAADDIESLKHKIQESTIKSNIDGIVLLLDAKENEYPSSNNNLIKVCNLSSYKAKVMANQSDAVAIKEGQKVSLKVKGLENPYTGRVTSIDTTADITVNGTNKESKVGIEISFDKGDSALKVGYEVTANIAVKETADTAAVNFEAVKSEKDGRKYVLVPEGNRLKKRYIKAGVQTNFEVEILEGLKAGEKFVPNPGEDLKDGDKITIPKAKAQ